MTDHSRLKLYWFSSLKRDGKNFGDWLSPTLAQQLCRHALSPACLNAWDLVAIGSLLHRINYRFWSRQTNLTQLKASS